MKFRTKAIALSLVLAMAAPFAFTSCDEEGKAKKSTGTNNVLEANNESRMQIEEGMTKEYFEANKYEVLVNSIDFEELFGLDDEVFNVFRNQKLKSGAEISLFVGDERDEANLTFSAVEKPFRLRYDISLDGEDINEVFNSDEPVEGSLYVDADKLSLEFSPILEDMAAGIEFGNIYDVIKEFSESDLAAMFGAPSYEEIVGAMDEAGINQKVLDEFVNGVVEFIGMYTSEQSEIFVGFENDVKEYTEGLIGEIGEAVIEENGKEIPVFTVKSEIDNNDIIEGIDLVFDMYEEYYIGIGSFVDELAALAGVYEAVPVAENALYMLEGMRSSVYDIFESLEIKGTNTSYIDKMTGKYIKSDYTYVLTDVGLSCESPLESEEIVITGTEYVTDNGIKNEFVLEEDEENTIDVKLDFLSESTDKYSIMLAFEASHRQLEETVHGNYGVEIDKTAKKYKLFADMAYPEYAESYFVKGVYDYTDASLTVSVDEIYDNNKLLDVPYENKVTVKAIDDVKPHENFVSIFDLSFMDILGIMSKVQNMQ